jgi:hypothetical protein
MSILPPAGSYRYAHPRLAQSDSTASPTAHGSDRCSMYVYPLEFPGDRWKSSSETLVRALAGTTRRQQQYAIQSAIPQSHHGLGDSQADRCHTYIYSYCLFRCIHPRIQFPTLQCPMRFIALHLREMKRARTLLNSRKKLFGQNLLSGIIWHLEVL